MMLGAGTMPDSVDTITLRDDHPSPPISPQRPVTPSTFAPSPPSLSSMLARLQELGEEVVALVVDDDERREVLDLDPPDRLHPELGIFDALDLLDAVLGQPRRRAADRAEIEAAVLLAGGG